MAVQTAWTLAAAVHKPLKKHCSCETLLRPLPVTWPLEHTHGSVSSPVSAGNNNKLFMWFWAFGEMMQRRQLSRCLWRAQCIRAVTAVPGKKGQIMLWCFFPVTLILAQTHRTLWTTKREKSTQGGTQELPCLIALGDALVMISGGAVKEHWFLCSCSCSPGSLYSPRF